MKICGSHFLKGSESYLQVSCSHFLVKRSCFALVSCVTNYLRFCSLIVLSILYIYSQFLVVLELLNSSGRMLTENLHVNSECNMVSEAVPVNRLTSGKAENSNHHQFEEPLCQDKEAMNGTSEFHEITTTRHGEPCGGENVTGIASGTTEDNIDVNPLSDAVLVNELDLINSVAACCIS